jgi:hypothetical protein
MSVQMLDVIVPNVIVLKVIMLIAVMLGVMAQAFSA